MGRLIDLHNRVFNKLTVIKRDDTKQGRPWWICSCKCGNEVSVLSSNLLKNNTKSCGCLKKESEKKSLSYNINENQNNLYKLIPLNESASLKVDADDYAFLMNYSWRLDSEGYARTTIVDGRNRRTVRVHKLLLNTSKDETVNYEDKDKLNAQRSNLRLTKRAQVNFGSKRNENKRTSKYKGVYPVKNNRFTAVIQKEGKVYNLGRFYNEYDAAVAYNNKAIELFGEFAFQNET